MNAHDITDETFEHDVLASDQPVLVDFWAPWCGPCRTVSQILEDLAAESHGRVRLTKVNVDENAATAARCGVLTLPTVIVFADGEPRTTIAGARKRAHYERLLAPWLTAK